MGIKEDSLRVFLFVADTSQTCYMAHAYYLSYDFMKPEEPEGIYHCQHGKILESLVHFATE